MPFSCGTFNATRMSWIVSSAWYTAATGPFEMRRSMRYFPSFCRAFSKDVTVLCERNYKVGGGNGQAPGARAGSGRPSPTDPISQRRLGADLFSNGLRAPASRHTKTRAGRSNHPSTTSLGQTDLHAPLCRILGPQLRAPD